MPLALVRLCAPCLQMLRREEVQMPQRTRRRTTRLPHHKGGLVNQLPDASKAIRIATTAQIDHWELGRLFGEWSNEEQFRFLHGAAHAFLEMGGSYALQLHYIAEEVESNAGNVADLKHFIRQLNNYINGDD